MDRVRGTDALASIAALVEYDEMPLTNETRTSYRRFGVRERAYYLRLN